MREFSKFFTPPVSDPQKHDLLRGLGLSSIAVHVLETSGNHLLQARKFEGGAAEPLLSSKLESLAIPSSELVLRIDHPGGLLTQEATPGQSLWQEILPYPWSLLCEAEVSAQPEAFAASLSHLRCALHALSDRMSGTELGCLWLQENDFPVLFHFVRRKCVRAGTAEHLHPLGEKFQLGQLNAAALREYFGTQASFFHLALPPGPPSVDRTSDAISAMLKDTRLHLTTPIPAALPGLSPDLARELLL